MFQEKLNEKLLTLVNKTISLNDIFLGTAKNVVLNKKMVSSQYKDVQITIGLGVDKNYKETTIKIGYNDIGQQCIPGKKYIQVIKIIDNK